LQIKGSNVSKYLLIKLLLLL